MDEEDRSHRRRIGLPDNERNIDDPRILHGGVQIEHRGLFDILMSLHRYTPLQKLLIRRVSRHAMNEVARISCLPKLRNRDFKTTNSPPWKNDEERILLACPWSEINTTLWHCKLLYLPSCE